MEQVIVDYLKHLKIPISEDYCKNLILSHPDYPSLLSISDTLDQLGVQSQIGRIEEEHLSKIEFPFLIHLENTREGLVLIKSKKDLSKDHIDLSGWKGIVLKAEPVEEISDAKHNEALKKERLANKVSLVLMVSVFGSLALLLGHSFTWINTVLLATSLLGIVVGYILFAKEIGLTYKPVESFCNTSTRVNCDNILNSDGAKLFSFFSLSQAVFSYFGFQLVITGLILGLGGFSASYLWVLAVGSALSIPVVVYSIYYQGIKAKTWCKLCMLVNGVLTMQAVFFGLLFLQDVIVLQTLELLPFVISLFIFLAIASAVILLKENSDTASKVVNTAIAGNRVKYDPEIFAHLLLKGNKVEYSPDAREMIIGNPTAPVQVLMVANLHCHPCKIGYANVLELLDQYPNQVNVRIKLLMSANTVHDLPASSFLVRYWKEHISGTTDESAHTRTLIQDWYATMSTEAFEGLYAELENNDTTEDQDIADVHYGWITKHKIHRTPTFFVNGYELPTNYRINDIGLLIAGLLPLLKEKNMTIHKSKELVE